MPRSRKELIVLGLIAALTGLLFYRVLPYLRIHQVEIGDQAPNFELSGGVRLTDYSGKLVLLNFWATWCPPCVLEIPELNAFYAEHRERGVELLAIAIDVDEAEELAAWTRERGVEYPVAIGDTDVAQLYGAEMFPFHVLVSPEGRIVERLTPGFHDREELAELIQRHGG